MPAAPLVFVSHASEDERVAVALKTLLLKAGNHGIRVFVSSDIAAKRFGDDWMRRIGEEVSAATVVLYLASHNSLASHWTQLEIGSALFRTPRPPIVSICINGLKVEQLPDPWSRFDAPELRTPMELRATISSILEHCKCDNSLVSSIDWSEAFNRLLDEQEEWLTLDHGLYSACASSILPHLERLLVAATPGQTVQRLYSALIEHVLQSVTFDGSPIDDRFWVVHGREIKDRKEWSQQKKLAYLLSVATQQKLVTGRKDSYGVMDLLRRQVSKYQATATDDELLREESHDFIFASDSPSVQRLFILREGKQALASLSEAHRSSLARQLARGVKIHCMAWARDELPPNFGIYGNVAVGQLSTAGINNIEFNYDTVRDFKERFYRLWRESEAVVAADISDGA